MTYRRGVRASLPSLVFSAALAVLVAGCSAKHIPAPGALMLVIDTNLKVPDDLDGIGISVTDQKGLVSEDQTFMLGPLAGGGAQFPGTFAVLRGTSLPVTIRAVGFKGIDAVTVREATTTIPAEGTALLHLDLDFLDEGLVQGTLSDTVSKLTVSCKPGFTPIGGTCQTISLDALALPPFTPSALGDSASAATSLDVDACLLGGSSVTPSSDCTLPVPSSAVNIGLMLRPGSAGWCNGDECVVPLTNLPGDGWSLGVDGVLHLPTSVCAGSYAVFTTPVTSSCPQFSLQHPAHQDYDGTGDDDADVGPSRDGSTGDATVSPIDAGDGGATAHLARTGILSFAVDDHAVYLVEAASDGGTTVEQLPIDFSADTLVGTTFTLAYSPRTGSTSAALYPYFAFASTSAGANGHGLVALDVTDAATAQPVGSNILSTSFDLGREEDGATALLYVLSTQVASYTVVSPGPGTTDNAGTSVTAVGAGPTTDAGTVMAIGSATLLTTGVLPGSVELVNPMSTPAELHLDDAHVLWRDGSGNLYVSGASTPTTAVSLLDGGVAVGGAQKIGLSGDRVFWVNASGALESGVLGASALGDAGAVVDELGQLIGDVSQLVVANASLYWFDTTGVYRLPLASAQQR